MGAGVSTPHMTTDALIGLYTQYTETWKEDTNPHLKRSLRKYAKMRKVGVPLEACVQTMSVIGKHRDSLTDHDVHMFLQWCSTHAKDVSVECELHDTLPTSYSLSSATAVKMKDSRWTEAETEAQRTYVKLRGYGLPMGACLQKIQCEKLNGNNSVRLHSWCKEWEQIREAGTLEQRRLNGEIQVDRKVAKETVCTMLAEEIVQGGRK